MILLKTLGKYVYLFIKWLVWIFYPKTEVVGAENLPEDACIAVGNHSQMNGPIIGQLYYPRRRKIWCAWQMQHMKEVPAYAYQDFWSNKPNWIKPFFKLLSYIIAPLCAAIFNNADVIPVYRDIRITNTFKATVHMLKEGCDILIFPEHRKPHNQILCDFQENFIDVARLYYKQTGIDPAFVPVYVAPKLKKIYFGKPTRFRHESPIAEERTRIKAYLMDEITRIAESLPEHTVVPYVNIPRKNYKTNYSKEAIIHDETGC